MPRADRRFSGASFASTFASATIDSAAVVSVRTTRSTRPSFTASATSCCCAPSWMFRSSFRPLSSCAATIRRRDSRRSATSAAFGARARPGRRRRPRAVPDRIHRLVRRHVDADLAERVALVSDLERASFDGGAASPSGHDAIGTVRSPVRSEIDDPLRADAFAEDTSERGEDVVDRVRVGQTLGEPR